MVSFFIDQKAREYKGRDKVLCIKVKHKWYIYIKYMSYSIELYSKKKNLHVVAWKVQQKSVVAQK